jgi:hypothetical protein
MQVFTATLTFGSSGTVSLTDLAGNNYKCTRIRVEPVQGNAHVAYMGGPAFAPGTSVVTGLIKQFQIPPASAAGALPLDAYELSTHTAKNDIQYGPMSFLFSGTDGEQLAVTVYVA